jgi:hypothetical protein
MLALRPVWSHARLQPFKLLLWLSHYSYWAGLLSVYGGLSNVRLVSFLRISGQMLRIIVVQTNLRYRKVAYLYRTDGCGLCTCLSAFNRQVIRDLFM